MKFNSILVIILVFLSCETKNCNDLPYTFKSYDEAIAKIKDASFEIEEEVDCQVSSWISGAVYRSCNGKTGFFILITKHGALYIHQDLPHKTWKKFKNADSFGTFYNRYIKGKYQLKIE